MALAHVAHSVDQDTPINNDGMSVEERLLSEHMCYVLASSCRGRALSAAQRAPEGWGIEAWRQLCIEFEPKQPSRFSR